MLASTDEFTVTIRGAGGHAAFPHLCVDPVVIASHCVTALQAIASRRVKPTDSLVITVGAIHAGSAPNVIPGEATMTGTVRALTAETRALAEADFRRTVTGVAEAMNAEIDIEWRTGYPVTHNDPTASAHVRDIAIEALGDDRVVDLPEPFMGGEDFAFYSQHVPAAFFIVGLKPHNADHVSHLHTPAFDFNDDALPTSIEMFTRLAISALPPHPSATSA
jgi:amidohydrolase